MLKKTLLILILLLIFTLIAACGAATTTPEVAVEPTPTSTAEPTEAIEVVEEPRATAASSAPDVTANLSETIERVEEPTATAAPSPTPTEVVYGAMTAQEAYDLFLAEAQEWQPDAALVTMQASAMGPVDAEGKSESWSAQFISFEANELNTMIFLNGALNASPLPNTTQVKPLPAMDSVILDTKRIYDIAAAAGGQAHVDKGANVSLSLTEYPLDETVPTWYVTYSSTAESNGLTVIVDARNDEVIQAIETP